MPGTNNFVVEKFRNGHEAYSGNMSSQKIGNVTVLKSFGEPIALRTPNGGVIAADPETLEHSSSAITRHLNMITASFSGHAKRNLHEILRRASEVLTA